MPKDHTEDYRRARVSEINNKITSDNRAIERLRLEAEHGMGNVWDTQELGERFVVKAFMAPYVLVQDRETDEQGLVEFQHDPRFYFNFKPEEK